MPTSPELRSAAEPVAADTRAMQSVHRPGRLLLRAALLSAAIGGGAALTANVPRETDERLWTRLKIKKAFVSRETSEEHRDAFSAPEFGWRILDPSGAVLARSSLYGDLYFPSGPDDSEKPAGKRVRLQLIERDLFADDPVAAVPLRPGVERYEFGDAGDFVLIERSRFEPDHASGADARPSGARSIDSAGIVGSVDFRGGDYTDYIRLPAGRGAVLLLREDIGLYWDLPGLISIADVLAKKFPTDPAGAPRVYPRNPSNAVLLDFADAADAPRLLRLRASIGGGKRGYRLFTARASGDHMRAGQALMKSWLQYLRASEAAPAAGIPGDPAQDLVRSSLRRGNLIEALLAGDAGGTAAHCRQRLGNQSGPAAGVVAGSGLDQERVFCAQLLYAHADPADLRALRKRFARESEYYQDALRSVHRRAERESRNQAQP